MTTSSRVKALLELTSTDQSTFAAAFGMHFLNLEGKR